MTEKRWLREDKAKVAARARKCYWTNPVYRARKKAQRADRAKAARWLRLSRLADKWVREWADRKCDLTDAGV